MNANNFPRQSGAALIVALVFLVIMTMLGFSSIRIVLQEERMTGHTFDRSLAFQAAEAALRVGEAAAQAQSAAAPVNKDFPGFGNYSDADNTCPSSGPSCSAGLCTQPDKDCPNRWEDTGFADWADVTGLSLSDQVAGTPQYFVEYMGGGFPCNPDKPSENLACSRYRVTARSANPTTAEGRATVVLQSIYATQ
ncbi:MAG: pilus assembly protein [Dechloromonas sp.]|nr:MAG: pilus assembly protein [Dechloromonas sp.]